MQKYIWLCSSFMAMRGLFPLLDELLYTTKSHNTWFPEF